LTAKINIKEISINKIDGDAMSNEFFSPDDLKIVYSEVLIRLTVEKIYEKNIMIGIVSYIKEKKL
tara:strand:- start:418 stop:612 length:195 start_codon:yes stop_codon:yes gene_type:complete